MTRAAIPQEQPNFPTVDRYSFEAAYAQAWHASRDGDVTLAELCAQLREWRDGATYPDDLPRLKFACEGWQWCVAAWLATQAPNGSTEDQAP